MAQRPSRVVDAHVHQWDPARVEWYPYLASDDALKDFGMDDVATIRRKFDQQTYLAETGNWNVQKYVHVAAAWFPQFLTETAERESEAQATGHPDAIIGAINPHSPVPEILDQLDKQGAASHFRGVRAFRANDEGLDHDSSAGAAVLTALQERNLVYDLALHPDEMLSVARVLARFDALTVVVEHTGWPLAEDKSHYRKWREGMTALADVGERVHCKLSGLAMTLNRFDATAFKPWIEYCLDVFGDDRCFFASNFPIDGLFGSFDSLYSVYDEVTSGLDYTAREKLFADNAERVYGCD
jgi:L-fuconolactonase